MGMLIIFIDSFTLLFHIQMKPIIISLIDLIHLQYNKTLEGCSLQTGVFFVAMMLRQKLRYFVLFVYCTDDGYHSAAAGYHPKAAGYDLETAGHDLEVAGHDLEVEMSTDVDTYYDNELLSHRSCCNKRRHRSADDTLLLSTRSAASHQHSAPAPIISTAVSSQRQYPEQLMLHQLQSAVQQSVTHPDDGLGMNSTSSNRSIYQQQVCRSAELLSYPHRVIIPHTVHCQLSVQTDTAAVHISTPSCTNRPYKILNLNATQTLSEERKVPNATKHIIVDCEDSGIRIIYDYSPADGCYSNPGFTGEAFESAVFH